MSSTYEWATPIQKRFQFISNHGPVKRYSEAGEPMQAENCSLVFKDGIIQISDESQTIIVSARAASNAALLIEFRNKIIAAFTLSSDCGLLVTHLNEPGGFIPTRFRSNAVALLMLPDDQPFLGFISVNPTMPGQSVKSGKVCVNDLEQPRIFVPENLMVMYQHLRNKEKAGKLPVTKHTFAEHELTRANQYPKKNIGNMYRIFNTGEAMRWLEKVKNHTPVEAALQREFVFGKKDKCAISFPKQQMEYVSSWCKTLGFIERPQFDEGEEMSESTQGSDTDDTNSQDEEGAASLPNVEKISCLVPKMGDLLNEFKYPLEN